jgi:hypothetical protein
MIERTETPKAPGTHAGGFVLQPADSQREGKELTSACQEAVPECCFSIEQSKAHGPPQKTEGSELLDIARSLASALSDHGLLAFVLEPSRDTASRT